MWLQLRLALSFDIDRIRVFCSVCLSSIFSSAESTETSGADECIGSSGIEASSELSIEPTTGIGTKLSETEVCLLSAVLDRLKIENALCRRDAVLGDTGLEEGELSGVCADDNDEDEVAKKAPDVDGVVQEEVQVDDGADLELLIIDADRRERARELDLLLSNDGLRFRRRC